jgi:hypothetical protein
MIEWAYPKSLHVVSAVWKAQLDGVIAGSPQQKPTTSILGNYGTATHLLRRLGERLSTSQENLPAEPSLSLVLIGPVLWTRYTAISTRRELQFHTAGPAPGDVVVVTDEPVIEAIVNGRLTADTAESRGLMRYYGGASDISAIRSFLR